MRSSSLPRQIALGFVLLAASLLLFGTAALAQDKTAIPATPTPSNTTQAPFSTNSTEAPVTQSQQTPAPTKGTETPRTSAPTTAAPTYLGNVSNGTCIVTVQNNLYKRAACVAGCYDSFCACLNTYYTASTIVDSEEPNDFSRLTCVTEGYLWVGCDYYTSCAAELTECVNAAVSSSCKSTLKVALLGAAVDDDYTTTAAYESCQFSACDLFGRQANSYGAQYAGKCELTTAGLDRICVNPSYFRGSLYLRPSEQWNVFYYLQYPYTYYQQQTDALRAALQSALGGLFPGYRVILQSVTSDAVLRVEFVVNGSASDDAVIAGMDKGRRTTTWLSSLQSYRVSVDYFGPRIYRSRSSSCFSFDRSLPYVSVSGVPLRVDIIGRNDTSCTSLNLGKALTLSANRADDLKQWNFEWSYQQLFFDSRNRNVGSLNITSALSASVLVTVHCPANGTQLSVFAQSATYSFYVGELWCLQPFPAPTTYSPPHITVWLSSTSVRTLAATLAAVYANAGATTTINVTAGSFGELALEAMPSFSAFQSRANALVDGSDGLFVADPCDAFVNGTLFPFAQSRNLVVLGGNYYGSSCDNASSFPTLAAVSKLVRSTDVIVTDAGVGKAAFANPLSRPIAVGFPDGSTVAIAKTLERYQAYRFERQPTLCTGSVVTMPPVLDLDMMEEGVLRWNRACNISNCCIGKRCSRAGERNCTLPMAISGRNQMVTLVTPSGTTVSTTTVATVADWSRRIYVSTWSQYTDSDSTVRVDVYRYTKGSLCFRLLCVNSTDPMPPIRQMAPFGSTVLCNPSLYTYYWYSWSYYWFTVYGWLQYEFAWGTLSFQRPASGSTPQSCAAVVLNYYENRSEIFSLNRPFDDQAPVGPEEGASLQSGGSIAVTNIIPIPPSTSAADRVSWCRDWAQGDALNNALQPRLEEMLNCFPCPAYVETVMPRWMFRVWGWGDWWYNYYYQENGSPSQSCFETYGTWQGSQLPWRKRCCYQGLGVGAPLIPGYPSAVEATNQWGNWPDVAGEMILSRIADKNPRAVCCGAAAATDYSCGYYTSRRTVGAGTTEIFRPLSQLPSCLRTWQVPPPWGWGWGDPYCTSFDGAGFECNFWGEVLWTGCGDWRVDVSAVPVSEGAAATVVNGAAVREGNDTVTIVRNNVTGEPNVTFNGNRVESPQEVNGGSLSLSWARNEQNRTTVRVTSRSGHDLAVDALRGFFAVRAATDASCIGKCIGLLGNCDGNKANDLVSRNGSVKLPLNASGAEIYAKIVLSYVVAEKDSLFIEPVSVPPTGNGTSGSFTPKFITAEVLASCPSVCGGNPGCCLDASVAGAAFANETVQALSTAAILQNQTIPLTGYNWPPSLSFQARVEALLGLNINTTITATDSDGVESLVADACTQGSNVTCTPVAMGNTTRQLRIETTATKNLTITIVAVDAKGASKTSYMLVFALPPPPPPANAATLSFNLTGSGAWGATEVYSLRDALSSDLAQVVNAYFGYTTESSSRRQSGIGIQSPPFTSAQDFLMASVRNLRSGQPVLVAVEYYSLGGTTDEASARATAVQAQPSLKLPSFESALKRLVPGAALGVPETGAPVPPNGTSSSSSSSSGAPGPRTLVGLLISVLIAMFML